jgi:SAM-dependent methyltransferase
MALLSRRGIRVVGLDASGQMLAHALAEVPQGAFVQGGAERLPWPDGSFHRVVCINAFHHFSDKRAFLADARRVLRPGGAVMTVGLDPHTGFDRWCIYDYFEGTVEIDKGRYPASSQIRKWMGAVGFTDCATGEVEHIRIRFPAREALERGRLDKTVTSQLSVLSGEEYQRGIDRIREELESAEARGEPLYLNADLRLYATLGSVPFR